MTRRLKALIVEDSEDDAQLMLRDLARQGYEVEWKRVETDPDMRAALADRSWEVVLSDFRMPTFSAPAALELCREFDPDLPFIVISGTVGEDIAVETMKAGAHDYLLKGNLARFGQAIEREVRDAGMRREHRLSLEKIRHLNRVLRAIRDVNQLIVREKDRERLIAGACECLVEARGYDAAWLALTDENQMPTIAAGRGYGDTWRELSCQILGGDMPGCAAQAIDAPGILLTDEQPSTCEDCIVHRHLGKHKTIAARLEHDGRVFGVMAVNLYGEIEIDDEEESLVLEIAGDIAFALHGIEQEQTLALETTLTKTLFEAIPDTLFVFEPTTGRAVRWNEAFRKISGYTDEEIASLPAPVSYYEADDLERAAQATTALATAGKTSVELGLVSKDGRKTQFEYVAVTIPGVPGNEPLSISIGRDIAERKHMQAQLAQSDRLASMGMLAAGVAHEINNPLCYVLYNLESLTDDLPKLSEALRKCLEVAIGRIGVDEWAEMMGSSRERLNPSRLEDMGERFSDALAGTQRIKEIARGLGTFSRVEQDRMVPVDLMHVIEAAVNMVHNEIKYRCRLVKEYGNIPSVMANDGRLSQVFLNLLVNAAHAIQDGEVQANEIRVRTWQQDDFVCAEVRDTGKGIAAEHLPRLFEPFFTTKEAGFGTGLGLPISRNIIEGYGGHIEVTSTLGEGTSFVVSLPIRQHVEAEETTRREDASASPVVRGRILVIDDEKSIRAVMARMLKQHELVQAASGHEGQQILESDQAFDLILCDVMMPKMSGVELHGWLVEKDPALAKRVVFVTGGAFTPKTREYLSKVGNIRLEKPFESANFRKIVNELIVAQRSRGS